MSERQHFKQLKRRVTRRSSFLVRCLLGVNNLSMTLGCQKPPDQAIEVAAYITGK